METSKKTMWTQPVQQDRSAWGLNASLQMSRLACLLFLVSGVLVFTGVAVAEDLLGVYFDEVAGVNTFETTVDEEIVTMYLTILSPSATEPIERYVGTVDFYGVPQWQASSPWGCGIFWVYPTTFVSCVATSPMPNADSIVVLEYLLRIPTPDTRVDIFLLLEQVGGPYYIAYGSTDKVWLSPTSGDFDVPVAVINGGAVGVSTQQWGSLKSMYR